MRHSEGLIQQVEAVFDTAMANIHGYPTEHPATIAAASSAYANAINILEGPTANASETSQIELARAAKRAMYPWILTDSSPVDPISYSDPLMAYKEWFEAVMPYGEDHHLLEVLKGKYLMAQLQLVQI